MMSDLRAKLIEAGAKAVDPFMVHPLETEDAAVAVLDAFLGCLAENAEEWHEQAEKLRHLGSAWENTPELLAVLGDAALGDTE